MIRKRLSALLFRISKWSLVTEDAPNEPTVFVGAPHTSNWDFIFMLAVAWHHNLDMKFVGKASLFDGWKGTIMRALGGIPVDRNNAQDVVEELVAAMKNGHTTGLVITPDGTRGAHEYWKSGFYRIAMESGLPVTLAYMDGSTKTTGLGPTFHLTGDKAADMDRIRAFFADKSGFYPERRVEPRLRDE